MKIIGESDRVIDLVGTKIEEMGATLLKELDDRQLESHLNPTGMRSVATAVMEEVLSNSVSQGLKEIKAMLAQPSNRVAEAHLLPQPVSNTVVVQGEAVRLYPREFRYSNSVTYTCDGMEPLHLWQTSGRSLPHKKMNKKPRFVHISAN
jgi:hypothetical protein